MSLTAGSQLRSIFLEKNPLDGGHYIGGAFSGTLNLSGHIASSKTGSLFLARINYTSEVCTSGHVNQMFGQLKPIIRVLPACTASAPQSVWHTADDPLVNC